MNINISLSTKSISKAIKKLEKARNELDIMVDEFLVECCNWFIHRANSHLLNSDIGRNVVNEILDSWTYVVSNGKGLITNTSDSAVFVEFGVGQIGQEIPHPNASATNYQYNVPSDSKFVGHDGYTYWCFYLDSEEDIDMHPRDYLFRDTRYGKFFITKGSWGELFAHTTLNDMVIEKAVLKGLWTKIKLKHWGK